MASNASIHTLYLQVQQAGSPHAVLGILDGASETEIHDAYRGIASRIHPDKASANLQELHTSLFQKVQAAHESLTGTQAESSSNANHPSKQLPETFASLHARNVAFKEALKAERARTLKLKNAANEIQKAKAAAVKAKNERLAEKRRLREEEKANEREKCEGKIAMESRKLEATTGKAKAQGSAAGSKPTARTATPLWDDGIDERLVSHADIKSRWDKNLLSGGRSGSVSLAQKKQRQNNSAARSHKLTMALCEEADHMTKSALQGSNRTFSGQALDAVEERAFVSTENKSQARTDRFLQVTDVETAAQYLLNDDAAPTRSTRLDQFASEE